MIKRTLIPVVAALVAAAGPTDPAAAAGAPGTGTWAGTLSQDLSALEDPYKSDVVVQAYRGRVIGFFVRVRTECADGGVMDAWRGKSYRVGRGPQLTAAGSFHLRVRPEGRDSGVIRLSGALGRARGEGEASARVEDCSGRGTWRARKRSY